MGGVCCRASKKQTQAADNLPQELSRASDIIESREARWESLVGSNIIVSNLHFSEESMDIVARWLPKPTDVLIATPPKTGTTWLQQITHQLRTGGDMKFDDIYQVSPWQLIAYDIGLDINDDQPLHKTIPVPYFPRLYKTHQRPSACPSGAKFILTIRNPAAVWRSYFWFLKEKKSFVQQGIPNVRDMNDLRFSGAVIGDMGFGAGLYDYYKEFWKLRHEENVLIICYEHLVKNTKRLIALIAMFIGLPAPDEELLATVVEMSSKKFMTEHIAKFDGRWCHDKLVEQGTHGHPEHFGKASRVTNKTVPVNDRVKEYLQEQWDVSMTSITGLSSYEDFADDVGKITEMRFQSYLHQKSYFL